MKSRTSVCCALALLLVLVFSAGCSSFGPEWRRAEGVPAGPDGIAGRWEGEWRSEVNRHHGRLRAVVTPVGDHRYDVRYRATYGGWMRFGYRMHMEVAPADGGACVFEAEADLGLWGNYQCKGKADGTNFVASYVTKFDRGRFTMQRREHE